MRAFIQWLALAPLFVLAGCGTFHRLPPSADSKTALSAADANRAEALAHYSQALISEITLGEFSSGVCHFRQAFACDPSNLPLALKVAVDYIGRKDYTGAVAVLDQALHDHPQSPELQLLIGSVRQAQGNPAAAIRSYRSAIRLAPDRPDGYVRLAAIHIVRLAPRKALEVVDDGLPILKDPAPLLEFCETVGRVYLAAKDPVGAIPFLERICQRSPARDDIRELLGRCYFVVGRNREAMALFEALLKKKPDSSQVALLLANLQAVHDPERALRTMQDAVSAFPNDLSVRVFLALLYVRMDRYEESLEPFGWVVQAMERDPTVADTIQPLFYFWYGGACERAGRPGESEKWMAKYLALNPEASEALNYLAYIWAEQGRNLDQALDYIIRALKAEPRNGAYLDTLGWVHFKKGNYPLALTYLNEALKEERKNDPAILDHIGDVWFALKQRDKAIRMWKKSIRMDPGNLSCREKLIREGVDPRGLPPMPEKNKAKLIRS